MKKKLAIVFCIAIALGILFRPQLVKMKDTMEVKLFHPLSGINIVLDPGHGGKDAGAQSGNVKEAELNLSIANITKALLEEAGATVTLTRDGNFDLASDGVKNRKRDDMKKRANMINDKKVDLFISVHMNAYPNNSVRGSQVFFKKGDENGETLANVIQSHFKEITKARMIPKAGDYFILNETNKLGVLVECGFISNSIDRGNLIQESFQHKVANVLYVSIRVGNENTKMINYTRMEATLIHVPFFSLPNMPMEPDRPLVDYFKDAGLKHDMKTGLIGWKMFTGSYEQNDQLFDMPHYLVQSIEKSVGMGNISNRIDLFIGEHGARIINNANELAHYEFGSCLASDGVNEALNHVELGISEMELASYLNKWGQRPSVVTVASTGERFDKANLYPSRKTVKHGDKMSLTVGYKGGLSCRVGYAVHNEAELADNVKDYLEVIAKPYYASIVNWLEKIHIGMSGDAMYQVTECFIPQADYHWTLNPGHLCADEEWLTCPIYPGSKETLKSGMLLQVDIIPTMPGYAGANCESGIALADEALRASIKEEYPALYERFMKRRAYMIDVLGIQLPEEVLLMNDTVAYYRPFFLNRTLAFVKK